MQDISVRTLCVISYTLQLVVFFIGIALSGGGAYLYKVIDQMGAAVNDEVAPIMVVLCVVGGALIVSTLLSIIGVCTKKSILLSGFNAAMSVILIAQFAAVVIIFTFEASLHYYLTDGMEHSILFYGKQGTNVKFTDAIDYIQEVEKCCGQYSYLDFGTHNASHWKSIKDGHLPDSCCKTIEPNCGENKLDPKNPPKDTMYIEGCYNKIKKYLELCLTLMGALTLAFMFIQLASIFLHINLQRKFKEHEDYQIQSKKVKMVKDQDNKIGITVTKKMQDSSVSGLDSAIESGV